MISRPLRAVTLSEFSVDALKAYVADWRRGSKKIVFTNGCFDILHAGHDLLLQAAACQYGDIVIVGVNTDKGAALLKGEGRPINTYEDRVHLLSSNRFVDLVIGFYDSPFRLIEVIAPDVLLKGDEYSEDDIIGAELVKAKGGEVVRFPMIPGLSTTQIAERLKKS